MPIALIVGPLAALVGIVAIFFVFRRKSVDKRSMYSARRSQIEHKVRAARQRTLTPRGKAEAPVEAPAEPAPTSIFAPAPSAPRVTYETSTYAPARPPASPPVAPAPPVSAPQEPAQWDVGPPVPEPSQFAMPEAPPAPSESAWTPASAPPEPAAPIEPPVWTPAPAPAPAPPEPATPVEPVRPAMPAASPTAWSVVSEAKESAEVSADQPRKKGGELTTPAWELASGEEPGVEDDEAVKPQRPLVAIAQYAVLVVGLVMVLIGVLVMVANSRAT